MFPVIRSRAWSICMWWCAVHSAPAVNMAPCMQVIQAVPDAVALTLLRDALCGYRRGIPLPATDVSCRTLPLKLTALSPHLYPIAVRACAPCVDAVSSLCLHLPDAPTAAVTPLTFITETLPALSTLTALDFTIPSVAHLRSVSQRETSDKRLAALLRTACGMPSLQALTLNLSAREPVPIGRFRRMLPRSLAEAGGLRRLTLERANLRADTARHLAAALEKLPLLEALELRSCGVDSTVAAALVPGLAVLPALEEIGFSNESLTGQAAADMLRVLPRPGVLRRIAFEVSLTEVGGGHGERLAAAIGAATGLRELSIDQKGKTLCWGRCGSLEAVARGLARHGTRCATLTRLELVCNGDADIAHACGQLLCHLPELRALTVRAVAMTPHGAATFAQGLQRKRHLSSVDLGWCRVDGAGLRPLMGAMHALPALKSANLSSIVNAAEMTGWDAAEIIAPALHDMHGLTSLQMCNGTVGAGGVFLVSQSFVTLRRLQRLDVAGNAMGGEGVRDLAGAAGGLSALLELNLSRNKISGSAAVELQDLLPRLRALTSLDVSNNPLACAGAAHLARGLCPPPRRGLGPGPAALQKLKLLDCGVRAEGMRELVAALRALRSLRCLSTSVSPADAGEAPMEKVFEPLLAVNSTVAVTVDGGRVVS